MIHLLLSLLLATPFPGPENPVEVVRVVDGDTIVVDVPDWPDVVGQGIHVRIYGIDAPELRSFHSDRELQDARRAKSRLEKWLKAGDEIRLVEVYRDKYFRLLAKVSIDGRDVGERLLAARLAQPYDGRTKQLWDDWLRRSEETPTPPAVSSMTPDSSGTRTTDSGRLSDPSTPAVGNESKKVSVLPGWSTPARYEIWTRRSYVCRPWLRRLVR